MTVSEVFFRGGGYFAESTDGRSTPIGWPGGGSLPLLPGWVPRRVCIVGALPICILELEHKTGTAAVWFLDRNLVYQTNDVNKLPEEIRQKLNKFVDEGLKVIWQELVVSGTPKLDPTLRWLSKTRGATRKALVGDFNLGVFPPSDDFVLDDQYDDSRAPEKLGILHRHWISKLLETDLLAAYLNAFDTGVLALPSPVDGQATNTDIGYVLTTSVVAHRFHDVRHLLTFYVVAGPWSSSILALYVPIFGKTFYKNIRARMYSSEFLGAPVHAAVARHIFDYSHLIEGYLGAPSRRPIVKYHQNHLGHHLWNELSGLERIVEQVPTAKLPQVYILGAAHSEMYGNVDQLFPELAGRVTRMQADLKGFVEMSYSLFNHVLLVCGRFVSRNLAKRTIAVSECSEQLMTARLEYDDLQSRGFRFVMLGLRVENRTLVDLADFCAFVVRVLSQKMGNVAIIIDGHNSLNRDTTQLYASHAEQLANKPPAEIEKEIVASLREHFKVDKSIVIKSTVGAPMCESIYWCNRCDFFITPWGAGLAKYRWVCNRPGLVLASPRFLREAGQETVHLYDSPMFMEDPTPLGFVSECDVQDEPQAEVLVNIGDANRTNFSVRRRPFELRLSTFIADTIGEERTAVVGES